MREEVFRKWLEAGPPTDTLELVALAPPMP